MAAIKFIKSLFLMVCVSLFIPKGLAQSRDTLYTLNLIDSANHYTYNQTQKSLDFAKKALELANQQKFDRAKAQALIAISKTLYVKGDYDQSLKYGSILDSLSKVIGFNPGKTYAINNRGLIFLAHGHFKEALKEFKLALEWNQRLAV